jgi:hypothetical protein
MLLFRSEEHVDKWCRDWHMARGAILTLDQCWKLAKAWYGTDRRDGEWRRRTPQETRALFIELGLTDPFWSLEA